VPTTALVWWCAPTAPQPELLALLDEAERARNRRITGPADRARHLTAHVLARVALGRLLDRAPAEVRFDRSCPECGESHGKPRLFGGEFEFSITHGGGRVGLAVARRPVGIDVEELSGHRYDPALVDYVLAPPERAELEALAAAARPAGFARYWTRKEAALKAVGTGIGDGLQHLQVSGPGQPARVLVGPPGMAIWLVELDPGPGFIGALAGLGEGPPRVRQLDGRDLLP